MNIEEERNLFEEWFERISGPLDDPDAMWLAWQASAALAQRQPLTDEQIDALWIATPEDPDGNDFVLYARAIERAHGIGATTGEQR